MKAEERADPGNLAIAKEWVNLATARAGRPGQPGSLQQGMVGQGSAEKKSGPRLNKEPLLPRVQLLLCGASCWYPKRVSAWGQVCGYTALPD